MSKKIIVISATPSHPQDRGANNRICQMCAALRELGHAVYFVYLRTPYQMGDTNINDMRRYWQDRFYVLQCQAPYDTRDTRDIPMLKRIMGAAKDVLRFGFGIFFNILRVWLRIKIAFEAWYDDSLKGEFIRLSKEIGPDAVIVEYAAYSKALECFDKATLKIIDTLDVFTDRHKVLRKNNVPSLIVFAWYSATFKEEKRALERADVVMGITDKDSGFFSKMTDKKVITVGHIASLHKPVARKTDQNRILFIGCDHPINERALNYFLNDIFPGVRAKIPDVQFIVAGSVCRCIKKDYDNCAKLGIVEDVKGVYDTIDIVVNPVLFATGLSIKSIEALGYSKPLVTTPAGATGLEDGEGKAFFVAESPEHFRDLVVKILSDGRLYKAVADSAYLYAEGYNKRTLRALTGIFG